MGYVLIRKLCRQEEWICRTKTIDSEEWRPTICKFWTGYSWL